MATENIVIGPIDDDAEEESPRSSFWEGLRGLLSTGATYNDAEENDLRYERRIWDKRIESFLDSHLPDYIHDFGILDDITLRVREERTSDLEREARFGETEEERRSM